MLPLFRLLAIDARFDSLRDSFVAILAFDDVSFVFPRSTTKMTRPPPQPGAQDDACSQKEGKHERSENEKQNKKQRTKERADQTLQHAPIIGGSPDRSLS
jgi:hypothetical protein